MGMETPLDRQVFYFAGFSRKGPQHHHQQFQENAGSRPSQVGETVTVSDMVISSALVASWETEWREASASACRTHVSVMRWEDVVRAEWPEGWLAMLRTYPKAYGAAIRDGMLGRLFKGAPAYAWLLLLPLSVSFWTLVCAIGWAVLLGHWLTSPGGGSAPALAVALALIAPTLFGWVVVWRILEVLWQTEWLVRLCAFNHVLASGGSPLWEKRVGEMADALIAAAQSGQCKEIILLSHSMGSVLACSMLAEAQRRAPWLAERGPRIGMLTLGQCNPLQAWFNAASRFRSDLACVARMPGLVWLDVVSPIDWAGFSNTPPWMGAVAGRALSMSPRFHAILQSPTFRRLRRRRIDLHMHYLEAPELAGGYDLVTLTTGPWTLDEHRQAWGDAGRPCMPGAASRASQD
jgi:hypothetical protein